jgi:hypothetical protein
MKHVNDDEQSDEVCYSEFFLTKKALKKGTLQLFFRVNRIN